MGRLDGKVALITGAGRGQGRAIARKLASEGAQIVAVDLCGKIRGLSYDLASNEDLAQTAALVEAEQSQCATAVADVRNQADLDAAVDLALSRFGRLDIACANAGIWQWRMLDEMAEDDWHDQIDVNLGGVWRTIKAVAPHMKTQHSGALVLTSSINATEAAVGFAHYVAAKHGVVGLMKSAALEFGPFGVRVNAVLPGPIDTPMWGSQSNIDRILGRPGGTHDDFLDATRNWNLLRGRTALPPSAIADGVMWLVSDEARHVTGQQLRIDAGHLLLPGFNHEPVVDDAVEM